MPLITNAPPATPVDPVTEVMHGVPVTDPYRWLEDQDSAQTREWLEQQAAYTHAYLDALPGRDRIRKRVRDLLAVDVISEPWKVGNRYFFLKRSKNQEQPVIMMREYDTGEDILLVDPAERDETGTLAVNILSISDDARHLAYSTRYGGEDSCAVEFLDVNLRATVSDRLPRGLCRGLVFSPDGRGFYYLHERLESPHASPYVVKWHGFGLELSTDLDIFSIDPNPNRHLGMSASPDGKVLGYMVVSLEGPRTIDFYIHDLENGKPPRRIVERMEGVFSLRFAGRTLLALTDSGSPNGRIVSIDPDHPQRDAWHDVVPETKARIQDLAIAEIGRASCRERV